jgi:hypothetical protein
MKELRNLRRISSGLWTDGQKSYRILEESESIYVFVPNAIIGRLLTVDANHRVVSISNLSTKISGTAGRLTSIDNGSGGVILDVVESGLDHGSFAGLVGDDHTQYHNDTRGDVRYYTKAQIDALDPLCRKGEVLVYKGDTLTYG